MAVLCWGNDAGSLVASAHTFLHQPSILSEDLAEPFLSDLQCTSLTKLIHLFVYNFKQLSCRRGMNDTHISPVLGILLLQVDPWIIWCRRYERDLPDSLFPFQKASASGCFAMLWERDDVPHFSKPANTLKRIETHCSLSNSLSRDKIQMQLAPMAQLHYRY